MAWEWLTIVSRSFFLTICSELHRYPSILFPPRPLLFTFHFQATSVTRVLLLNPPGGDLLLSLSLSFVLSLVQLLDKKTCPPSHEAVSIFDPMTSRPPVAMPTSFYQLGCSRRITLVLPIPSFKFSGIFRKESLKNPVSKVKIPLIPFTSGDALPLFFPASFLAYKS